MMIGGETDAVQAPRSDLHDAGARASATSPRTPGREKVGGTAEQGYLHCGPNGAGHFVKMVHNGIEYGIMAAYAEGLNILHDANVGKQTARRSTPRRRRCAIPSTTSTTSTCADIAEVWRRGSVIASWLLDLTATALIEDPSSGEVRGPRLRLRRRPLDDQGRHRRGACRRPCSPPRSTSASARAARPTSPNKLLSAMRYEFGGHLEKPAKRMASRGSSRSARRQRTGVCISMTNRRARSAGDQHHPHAVDRRGAGGQVRPSRHADGAGAAGLHALEPGHALRSARTRSGPIATASCCRTATPRCCCGRCCTSPAPRR